MQSKPDVPSISPERKSETLIISQHFLAERVRRWGIYQWKICRIEDILANVNNHSSRPSVFCAQTGHDALMMIEALEELADAK
jgi:hypothetical protein